MKKNYFNIRINLSEVLNPFYWVLIIFITVFTEFKTVAQTTTVIISTGTSTWTVPAGVTGSITVEVCGAGGSGGGCAAGKNLGGSGGTGGTYVSSIFSGIVGGTIYNLSVASSTSGTSGGNGSSGASSWFNTPTTLFANGGLGGLAGNGAARTALTTGSIGTTIIAGGNSLAGNSAIGAAGGAGGNGGGAGGTVVNSGSNQTLNGNSGTVAGGGGSGGAIGGGGGGAANTGGIGAAGQIKITYTNPPTITSFSPNNACIGSGASVIITGSNFTGVNAVNFNGVASSFIVNSSTQITATLPGSATTGTITITKPSGTVTSAANFTINPLPVPAGIISGVSLVCQGQASVVYSVPLITNASSYTWTYSGTGATILGSTNSITINFAANATSGNLNVYGVNTCGSGTVSVNYPITVNPILVANVSISASANTVCAGTLVTFTATPINGGTAPSYQWKLNGSNVGINSTSYTNSTIANDDIVSCVIISNATPCLTGSPATSNAINMTVNPNLQASISIAASANLICAGTLVTFTATPINGGTTPSYQWKLNGSNVGINSTSYTNATLANGDKVTCILTSNATCATGSPALSNEMVMTVNPILVANVSISVSANPVCAGTLVTFTATPTNGGTTPSYQWKLNGVNVGTNSTTYTNSLLANSDIVSCVLTSNATPCLTGSPVTSNAINMTVNPNLPVSISIAASANPICTGTLVTFTATPINGGTAPSYQWKLNGSNVGINSTSYTNSTLANGDIVSCVIISNATPCLTGSPATSNGVNMTVNPFPDAAGIISGASLVCQSQNSVFYNVPAITNANSYIWTYSGTGVTILGSTNSVSITFAANATSGNLSVYGINTCGNGTISANYPITVNPLPVSAGTISGVSPVCQSQASVVYSVPAITNASSYTWNYTGIGASILGSTNSVSITFAANATSGNLSVYVVNACGNGIVSANYPITINSLPVIISQPTATSVCTNGTTSFSVSATGTSTFQWRKNGVNLANTATFIGVNTAILTISNPLKSDDGATFDVVLNGATCPVISDPATLTIFEKVLITSQPITSQIVCEGNAASLNIIATGDGLSYQWFKGITPISGETAPTLTFTSLVLGDGATYHCVVSGTSPCNPVISNNSILNVNQGPIIITPPAISQTVCEGDSVSFSVGATIGSLSYQWYKGATALANGGTISGVNSATLSINPVNTTDADSDYNCVVNNGCFTETRSSELIVNPTPNAVATNSVQTICSTNAIATMVLSGNVSGTTFAWTRDNTVSVTGIATSGSGNISGSMTNSTNAPVTVTFIITPTANGCVGTPITANVLVNPTPNAVASNSAQTICSTNAIATMVLSGNVTGTTFAWTRDNSVSVTGIATSGSGNISGSMTNSTNSPVTVTFTITPTANGCVGIPITATVLVNPTPNAVASNSVQTICSTNAIATMVLSGNVSGTTFAWTRDNTVSVTGIAASGSGNISGSFTNSTNLPVPVTFTITPTANGCVGLPITATIIVQASSVAGAVTISLPNTLPVVTINTVCHFANGSLYLSGQTGTILRWEASTTGGSTWTDMGNAGNATYNYINITQTSLFRAVVQNASCTIVYSATSMINVIPNIKPDPVSATPSTICNGDSSTLVSQSGYATSQNLATGGAFENANPPGWLVDGCGNCLNASADNGTPTVFKETNSSAEYGSSGKFAIARGNFNSILQTPIFNTLGLTTASLNFNYAYKLLAGATAKVELSLDGGANYTIVLATYTTGNQGPYNLFTTNMNIDLSAYLGQTNLRIRFNYLGTTNSSLVLDNIKIPEAPVGVLTSQWVDTNTGLIISNTNTTNAIVSPTVTTTYAVTSFLNGCTSSGPQGTTYITVTVNARPTANIGVSQTICYNGTATFSVALTGVAPWTIKYSNGTTNSTVSTSSNPYTFSVAAMTANKTYSITGLSDSRCTAYPSDLTGSATVTVLNGTAGLWTGLVSTDWYDCMNWAGGLPSSIINAVINSGLPRMPIIDRSSPLAAAYSYIANAQDLIIASGASVTMVATNNSELQISRDWKNSGTFIPGTGTITFNGSTSNQIQNINNGIKTNETFYNLTTNNSGGAKGISVVDGFELTVSNNLSLLSGNLRLTGEAQLVQAATIANPTAGSGVLLRDQQGQQNSFNYNYWSSPVSSSADFTHYSVSGVLRDGTDVTNVISVSNFNQESITFGDGAYFADGPLSNPIKISNRWLWNYGDLTPDSNTALQNYNQWNYISSTGFIKIGEGFTMKGTGGIAPITATQNYVFAGKPNSGTISIQLLLDDTHLIGNPYPSALDADKFIRDNLRDCFGCTASVNVFGGALYFWDHFSLSNNHLLAEYEGGYATYTLMGGVNAIADIPLTANTGLSGSKIPQRYIPVGQAFFVDAILDTPLPGTMLTVDGGNIVFKNSQRAFVRENSGNSLFMKTSGTKNSKIAENADTRPKIRLGFDSSIGKHRQLLVGADANTSNLFDIGYDAEMYDTNDDDMFWEISDSQFVIQAIPDFNIDRIIPLGIVVSNEGLVTIKIDALENVPSNTEIFLFDNTTGIYHPIKSADFKVYLPVDQYNNRFSITFSDKTLSVTNSKENEEIIVLYSNNYKTLIIRNNTLDSTVNSVNLYNMLGQFIAKWNVEEREQTNIQIPIKNISSGIYAVKIRTSKGESIKKIIVN